MKCEYGCGNDAKYKMSSGKWCCSSYYTKCPANKKKNSEGVKKAHKDGKLSGWDHLTYEQRTWNKDKMFCDIDRVLVTNSLYKTGYVKKLLINSNIVENKCNECGIDEWNGKDIILELHHKNGINRDHRIENLELLCPNCHSQTDTFRGKGKHNNKKVEDDKFINALKKSKSIRSALICLGLSAKGGNYFRADKLISENNITVGSEYKKNDTSKSNLLVI